MTLSHERLLAALEYDPISGLFSRNGKLVGSIWRRPDRRGSYLKVGIGGKQYLAHRLAWFYVTGLWPSQIDHIDQDGTNNRWANLRLATHSQNRVNSPAQKHSRSKKRGIHRIRNGRYRVQLQKDNKSIHVGYFNSLAEAIAARDLACPGIHGEFFGD